MGAETCGDCWMAEESVLIFIILYTPVIPISLASKPSTTNKPILLAIVILSPTVALSVPYLLLFSLNQNPNPTLPLTFLITLMAYCINRRAGVVFV